MDDFEAPRYVDFTAPSPQVSVDDYFNRVHVKHEHKSKMFSESPKKLPLSDISYPNENILQNTPVRKLVSKGPKNFRKNIEETTTYESVLSEAMNNLQLSMKSDKSFNKSCLMDEPSFKTKKRVTRSICAKVINTPCRKIQESHMSPENEKFAVKNKLDYQDDDNKENEESIDNKEIDDNISEETSQIKLEVTLTSTENETSHEKSKIEQEPKLLSDENKSFDKMEKSDPTYDDNSNQNEQLPPSEVVTSLILQPNNGHKTGPKKKATLLTGNAWHRQVKRRMSILNQQRLSLSKIRAPTPEHSDRKIKAPHVSLAEAVLKFQRATPQRFHTGVKPTKTEQLRKMSLKLTKAHSPALMSKNRNRPVTAMSREEKEKLEMENMRQNQFKANPLRKDILTRPAPIKKVEKKMVTNPEPFQLTKTKKEQQPPVKSSQEIKRTNSFTKKTVPSIVQDENGIIVKDEEVLGFGIPVEPCKSKKINTKVQPFSFEARNKELAMKKQERLKKMQEAEQNKNKIEFHARPVPAAVKTPINMQALKKDSEKTTKITLTRSVSFENRVKQIQQKKDEKIKQMLEEEKKARIFKAQKVPEFKPVLVRGRSRDNLKKSVENLTSKSLTSSDSNKKLNNSNKRLHESLGAKPKSFLKAPVSVASTIPKKMSPSTIATNNKENKSQGAVPKIMAPKCKISQKSMKVLSELNTEKRAKERKEFDEKMKQKDIEDEEKKRREEEERIANEKKQTLELRKMAEVKARPMPIFKPVQVIKSNKALTDPQSPAWTRKRSTH